MWASQRSPSPLARPGNGRRSASAPAPEVPALQSELTLSAQRAVAVLYPDPPPRNGPSGPGLMAGPAGWAPRARLGGLAPSWPYGLPNSEP
jgi:hypothetical protein